MSTPTTNGTYAAPPAPPAPPQPPQPDPAWSHSARVHKSPGLAAFLSFFPGLGQVYLGLYQRAAVLALGFFFGIFIADKVGEVGFLIAFLWFFGVFDAYRQAQIINMGGIDPTPKAAGPGQRSLGFGVFLTVVGLVLLINNFYPIDFSWLADWWPAFVVALGVYFIWGAVKERQGKARAAREAELASSYADDTNE